MYLHHRLLIFLSWKALDLFKFNSVKNDCGDNDIENNCNGAMIKIRGKSRLKRNRQSGRKMQWKFPIGTAEKKSFLHSCQEEIGCRPFKNSPADRYSFNQLFAR